MDPDQVFVRKVEDLQRRSDTAYLGDASDAEYEVLMAAPLLRELLMGQPLLIHLVNKERRMKVRFRVASKPAYEEAVLANKPVFLARVDGMDPNTALPGSRVEDFNLSQFLREWVFLINGQKVSVRDLIDFVANAAGAVHFGDKEKNKRAILDAVSKQVRLGGADSVLRFLLVVGRIVVDGLTPLMDRVKEERGL